MRWARFAHDGRTAFGIVEGDRVAEVSGGLFDPPSPTGRSFAVDRIRLLPPVIPATFYAAGTNYRQHLQNAESRGEKVEWPTRAEVNYRASNALIGDGDAIVIPADSSGRVAFEGELVVVIGKRAKRLSRENALDCVFGYTIGNDVSERFWQNDEQNKDVQWWRAKGTDTFGPVGPYIARGLKYDDLLLRMRQNGQIKQEERTRLLIHDVASTVSFISQHVTLHPGDLIFTGTPGTTAAIQAGDVLEVELEGVGVLRNPVVAEK